MAEDKPQQAILESPILQPIGTATPDAMQTDHLISVFRDVSATKRVEALELLDASAIDDATMVPFLREALYDQDPLVSQVALGALGRRDNEQNPVLNEADLIPFQGQTAELVKVHFAAMKQDTLALCELMKRGDAVVQESAFETLAGIDTALAIDSLKSELDDKTSLYRLQTLELLVRSPYTDSPELLLPLLQTVARDPDPLVRDYAQRTLKERESQGR